MTAEGRALHSLHDQGQHRLGDRGHRLGHVVGGEHHGVLDPQGAAAVSGESHDPAAEFVQVAHDSSEPRFWADAHHDPGKLERIVQWSERNDLGGHAVPPLQWDASGDRFAGSHIP
ncbi:hypothetical protein GCM10009530_75400 [Microbispora corallina]|uniref:Uncharacterized protein n=1 Tax=Microbispora corallina TaxID=83302 RepID=A0ABQ4G6T6_9ACTN|nr:hypothetical protein Mco01_57970 [Microbispora corallina]